MDDDQSAVTKSSGVAMKKRPAKPATRRDKISVDRKRIRKGMKQMRGVKREVKRWAAYRKALDAICDGALVDDDDGLRVYCAVCGTWTTMACGFEVDRFQKHCNGKGHKARMKTRSSAHSKTKQSLLKSFFTKTTTDAGTGPMKVPCCGIRSSEFKPTKRYLKRSPAAGGGGESLHAIAQQLYKKSYSQLSAGKKRRVQRRRVDTFRWHNYHELAMVKSPACTKMVYARGREESAAMCHACTEVLYSKSFRAACRKDFNPAARKYLPKNLRRNKLRAILDDVEGMKEVFEVRS